ncbi:dihydropteroate synthase [Flavobacteriaceae bacterium TP-CH-4]|uniref:Dihydropteroate synthase n=1 Tax=Pelagihabitans pacificus TaxID=2696054 RepID=A0A967AQ54_9FLAO|nr:dihydropteroate synthase [Pelagihabitans pacificus]NHF57952.1 dihydropteroate synthase [Pelagihabitans pacificus]
MTLNCKGILIDLTIPKVMGILNITPDSFYDGGRYKNEKTILSQVEKMLNEGATFIDVGAYSSRPGADFVSEIEELKRLLPVVQLLLRNFPDILLSIDTFRSKVAKESLEAGAAIINDISAGIQDGEMLPTIAKYKAPYVMMHMRGTPKTMQQHTQYDDLLIEVLSFFSERIAVANTLGLHDLIIDPGFGFAKTLEQNYELLQHLDRFKTLGHPLLVGISRKSMIYKALGTSAQGALNGSTALHTYTLTKGANILRAHDVKEARECVQLMQRLI